jgi:hypothetical protein
MRPMAKFHVRVLVGAVLGMLFVFCNRNVGGGLGHIATPNPDGTVCNNDVECASDHCVESTCQPPANGEVEIDGTCSGSAPCVADATCEDGICVASAMACAALLAPCAVDDDCCSANCAYPFDSDAGTGGTCTAGASMCAAEAEACIMDSDCCAGLCDFNEGSTPGRGRCSSSCIGFGATCHVGGCCTGYCGFGQYGSYQCMSCLTPTSADGVACKVDSDCCSEQCVGATARENGTCQCTLPGACSGP